MTPFLQYSGIILLSLTGILIGRFLIFIAPEELEPGRKWFHIFAASLAMTLGFLSMNHLVTRIITGLTAFIAVIYIPNEIFKAKNKNKYIASISFLAGILVAISANPLLSSAIAFLFLMPLSSMMLNFNKKDVIIKRGIVKHKWQYLREIVLPCLPYLISLTGYFF